MNRLEQMVSHKMEQMAQGEQGWMRYSYEHPNCDWDRMGETARAVKRSFTYHWQRGECILLVNGRYEWHPA
jgi:hypothetical protein